VEIVDHNRVIVDGPTTDVKRQVISIKRLSLTKFVVEGLPRGARTPTVRKYVEKSGLVAKFQESAAGQKIAKAAIRRNLTDFDRHKVMLLQKKVFLSSFDQ
jgi:large subunit ribosomal protein L14e